MVQTFVANKALEIVSQHIEGNISFEKIHFKPFSNLVIKNIAITDASPTVDPANPDNELIDTLFRAKYIVADFSLSTLFGHEGVHIDEVLVKDALMNLVLEDSRINGSRSVNLMRMFKLENRPEGELPQQEIFNIKKAKVEGMTFAMYNYAEKKIPYYGGINWNDLVITDIYANADDLGFKGGAMSGHMNRLSFKEKSGYICDCLSGDAYSGNRLTHLTNLRLEDPWSVITVPDGKLIYENGVKDLVQYVQKVVMDIELGNSQVDFKSISYFAPQLEGNRLKLDAYKGRFYGTVEDFQLDDITVAMEGGGFSGTVSGRLAGLPDVNTTTIEGQLKNCKATSEGLSRFVSYWMKEGKLDLSDFAKRDSFTINGKISGTLNKMMLQPDITSSIGSATGTDICIEHIIDQKPIRISGAINTRDLDAGRILGSDLMGPTTLSLNADAIFGGKTSSVEANIKSLSVERLNLYGYDYTDIYGEAVITDKSVDGRLTCNDPNLNFMTQGRYDLASNGQDTKYDFVVMLGDADLHKINIDKRGKSKIRFMLNADFTRTPSRDIFGDIAIHNLWLENDAGSYNIGDITVNSINRTNTTYKVDLNSSFAQGSLVGTAPVTEFIKDLLGVTLKRELPSLFEDPSYQWSGNRYKLSFHFGNTQDIISWALPGMYIASNTTLEANINDRGRFNASLQSQRIAFGRQYLTDMSMNINNNDDMISGEISGSELKLATIRLKDNAVKLLAEDDHLGVGYHYDNNGELTNKGEFVIHGDLSRKNNALAMDVKLLPSSVFLNSREWRIKPSTLTLVKDGVKSSHVEFVSDDQRIYIHGGTSLAKADTLNLDLERFDLAIVNPVFETDLGVKGTLSGNLQLTSPMSDKGILVDITSDSTYFANCEIGQLRASSNWDEDFKIFNIIAKTEIEGRTGVDAKAKFTPKTKNLEAYAKLDKITVGYLQPLMNGVFSDLNGYVSGEVEADGPINNLSWESRDTRIEDGVMKVDFTNVPYYVDGSFRFTDQGLFFDNINGHDQNGGTAVIGGGIKWDRFQNVYYDINIKCNEIEGINLTEKQNEYFYGNVAGTGNITFTGPSSNMVMNVEATTAKRGTLNVPISYTSVSGRSNLLKFTEIKEEKPIDPYEIILEKMDKSKAAETKFTTNLKINARPDVEAVIWIDKAAGHVISGQGNGTIQMLVNEDVFDITGDYEITKGSYKFAALGIVSRGFEIQDGSSITFNGDIFDSVLDIDAMYKTKANIGTLIGDSTSVSNRRTVECKIKITDKMLNPRLQFGIEIPELDPTVKSRVESALSTEDKVQKQFLSLLLSNSFLPDEQSGIVNNSTMLYSNVSEVMASQLNNILEKLNIPVDLGLNYQPNSKGNDVFDVAVSTQMFNNRVVVNGSVGNKQYTEKAQTDVVGDLDIEIKLNKSGALRLNVFSHSADSYTNYLDNSQRNGVGLTYQTEFSSFRQFIKNLFSSRKKRLQAKQAEEAARNDEERVILKIE